MAAKPRASYDPRLPLPPDGPPLSVQEFCDYMNGRLRANRAAFDKAIKAGLIPGAVKIQRRWFIPRPVAHALLTGAPLPPDVQGQR